jgi:excisionase family DNA binding protein
MKSNLSPEEARALLLQPFLTPAEARAVLRISRNRVYEMLRAGTLPAIRDGRTIRVPSSALQQFGKVGAAA